MAKTKKSDNLEYCRGIRVMDVAVYVFALLAFGVYPLIYDDHYFNITITKYHFFLYAAGIYLALALIGYVSGSDDRIRCAGTACAPTDDHVYLFCCGECICVCGCNRTAYGA